MRTATALLLVCLLGTACGDGATGPAPVPTTISIEPASVTLRVDRTQQLSATVLDQHGSALTSLPDGVRIRWRSSDSTRVVVDSIAGLARGVRPGAAELTVSAGQASGTRLVSVTPSVPVTVQISGNAVSLRIADTVTIAARALDDEGRTIDLTREGLGIDWQSSDTLVARVDSTGRVRAVRPGQTSVLVRAGTAQIAVPVTVLRPQVRLEAGAEVKKRMGRDGGVLTTMGSGGKRYTLTVPAGALRDSAELTLTPVAAIDNLPVGTALVAAAHFAPEGLRLARPAVLRITGAGGSDPRQLVGFSYDSTGAELQRAAAGLKVDTIAVLITHFSGAGAAMTPDASTLPIPVNSTAAEKSFADAMALVEQGRQTGVYNVEAIATVLRNWYNNTVRHDLGLFATDQLISDALWSYGGWYAFVHCGANECGAGIELWPASVGSAIRGLLTTEIGDARDRLRIALLAGIQRANQKCTSDRDLQAAANVFYWQSQAEIYGLGTQPGLELVTVKAELCVAVVIVSASFPSIIEANTPAPLAIKAGLSFGGGAPVFTPDLLVDVSASGTTDPYATGFTTNGSFTRAFTATAADDVAFNISVSLLNRGLDAYGVFADTLVERNLDVSVTVTPVAAILDIGAQATFQATVTGTSNTAVTWSSSGGQRATNGNTLTYTAGSTPGTYAVTARSVADPNKSASARIEIVGDRTVYTSDFSATTGSEWSQPSVKTSPSGQRYLGDFQNHTLSLSLNALAAHSSLTIEFDFHTIRDWEGSGSQTVGGPDIVVFRADGPTVLQTTFSTKVGFLQAYPGIYPAALNPPMSGASATGSLGYPGGSDHPGDATYRIRFTLNHSSSTFVFSITGLVNDSSGPITGERWGIDNVRVITR